MKLRHTKMVPFLGATLYICRLLKEREITHIKTSHQIPEKKQSTLIQARSQNFTLQEPQKLRGCTFFSKKVDDLF